MIYLPAVCKDVIFFFFTLGVFSTSPVMEIEGPDHPQDKALWRTFVIDKLWFKVLGGEGGSQQLFPVNSGRGWDWLWFTVSDVFVHGPWLHWFWIHGEAKHWDNWTLWQCLLTLWQETERERDQGLNIPFKGMLLCHTSSTDFPGSKIVTPPRDTKPWERFQI